MAKHDNDKFDGYSINVFQDEDGDWIAYFTELPNISAGGENPEEAIGELSLAWEATKESYRKNGEEVPMSPARKQYSGQFNVRIDKRVHKSLAIEAAKSGVSLNALVAQKLSNSTNGTFDHV